MLLKILYRGTSLKREYISTEFNCRQISVIVYPANRGYIFLVCAGIWKVLRQGRQLSSHYENVTSACRVVTVHYSAYIKASLIHLLSWKNLLVRGLIRWSPQSDLCLTNHFQPTNFKWSTGVWQILQVLIHSYRPFITCICTTIFRSIILV